jgi:DNA mismatch endonuclease, patch repair protein
MFLRKKSANKKPLTRSEIMGRVKSKNTKIEILLRKALWKKGYRYRVNYKKLAGTPDIVFVNVKLAIFCDSEFWHGKHLMEGKSIPKTNTEFWVEKIRRNMERDKEIDQKLKEDGWRILHFWGEEIKKDLVKCIEKIEECL